MSFGMTKEASQPKLAEQKKYDNEPRETYQSTQVTFHCGDVIRKTSFRWKLNIVHLKTICFEKPTQYQSTYSAQLYRNRKQMPELQGDANFSQINKAKLILKNCQK